MAVEELFALDDLTALDLDFFLFEPFFLPVNTDGVPSMSMSSSSFNNNNYIKHSNIYHCGAGWIVTGL